MERKLGAEVKGVGFTFGAKILSLWNLSITATAVYLYVMDTLTDPSCGRYNSLHGTLISSVYE